MSRCFPYPRPGYTLSRANNDDVALIESIKLQKEKETSRELKKEKRSEKKDEKEKRKQKRNDVKNHQNKVHKSDISKSWTVSKIPDAKVVPVAKGKAVETEQLERSDLTQENGLPVNMEVLPTSSAESTDTSNKRKRLSSPDNRTGNILRIKLASKKQKSDPNPGVNELRVITKSEIVNRSVENKDSKNVLIHGREDSSVAPITDQICPKSGPVESLTNGKSLIQPMPSAVVTSSGRKERKFNELILNWSPPQLLQQQNLDAEDLDWLFGNSEVKPRKTQNDAVSCLSSSLMQPRAQLLSEVNIYALPFTVPF